MIVADAQICSEIRSLEKALDEDISSDVRINDEAETIKFLHELGWIFQSTSYAIDPHGDCGSDRSLHTDDNSTVMINPVRFKGVLRYAVIRDWCAVVKKLLDLMFDIGDGDELFRVLSDVNLIHEAVKRKCRLMVELLLHYKPKVTHSSRFQSMFTPVVKRQCGFSPLHVAATMSGAEEMIDILTNDPYEVKLLSLSSFFYKI